MYHRWDMSKSDKSMFLDLYCNSKFCYIYLRLSWLWIKKGGAPGRLLRVSFSKVLVWVKFSMPPTNNERETWMTNDECGAGLAAGWVWIHQPVVSPRTPRLTPCLAAHSIFLQPVYWIAGEMITFITRSVTKLLNVFGFKGFNQLVFQAEWADSRVFPLSIIELDSY